MLITISLVLCLLGFVLTNILIGNYKVHQVMQYRVFEKLKLDELMHKASSAGIEYYVKKRKELLSHSNNMGHGLYKSDDVKNKICYTNKMGNINKTNKTNKVIYYCNYINLKNNLYGFYKVRFILDYVDGGDSNLFVGQGLLTIQVRDLSHNSNKFKDNNCDFNSQEGILISKNYVLV